LSAEILNELISYHPREWYLEGSAVDTRDNHEKTSRYVYYIKILRQQASRLSTGVMGHRN